jgi:hypothetical protein
MNRDRPLTAGSPRRAYVRVVERHVRRFPLSHARHAMNRLLVLLLAGGFATAAFAQSAAVEQSLEPGASAIGAQASDRNDPNCLRETGSRITAVENQRAARAGKPADKCANATGRAYDRDDIDRTGAIDAADALRKLDTSIH